MGTLGDLIAQARQKGITAQEIDRRKLDAMSITGSHQGIIALCAAVPYRSLEDMLALARERGKSPCWCCVTASQTPTTWGPSSARQRSPAPTASSSPAGAAPGSTRPAPKLPPAPWNTCLVAKVSSIASAVQELKKQGLFLFAADMDGQQTLYEADFTLPTAIVIGSEGTGVSALVKQECDFVVRIPQKGRIPSLNASNAAAVLLFEALRKRL